MHVNVFVDVDDYDTVDVNVHVTSARLGQRSWLRLARKYSGAVISELRYTPYRFILDRLTELGMPVIGYKDG